MNLDAQDGKEEELGDFNSKLKLTIETIHLAYVHEGKKDTIESNALKGAGNVVNKMLKDIIVDPRFPEYGLRLFSSENNEKWIGEFADLLKQFHLLRSSVAKIYCRFFECALEKGLSSPSPTRFNTPESNYIAACLMIIGKCLEEIVKKNGEAVAFVIDTPKTLVSNEEEWTKFIKGGIAYISTRKTRCCNTGKHGGEENFLSIPLAVGVSILTEKPLCKECLLEDIDSRSSF